MRTLALFAGLAAATMMTAPSAQAQSGAPYNQTISGTRLDISATGEVKAVPDIAIINAGVVTQAADAASAMAANATKMKAAVAALKQAGVADKDIQSQSISLQPQYRYVANKPPVITGYQASNQITIRFRDIGKAGSVLDALVKQGINQIDGPSLTIDKPDVAMDEARVKAMTALRARADVYARSLGMSVKRIVAISESARGFDGPQPMMMRANMAMAEQAADTTIAPGEQAISVTVNAVFELG
jgi:uncharacterized protein